MEKNRGCEIKSGIGLGTRLSFATFWNLVSFCVRVLFSSFFVYSQWATLSFQGPVQQLSELFEELLSKLKPSGNRTAAVTPSTSPSVALPLVAAINVRLMLLRPDHTHLSRLEEEAEMTVNESKMMYCEAVRRLSLSKWPHKDYVYVGWLYGCRHLI